MKNWRNMLRSLIILIVVNPDWNYLCIVEEKSFSFYNLKKSWSVSNAHLGT
jgi:hypothetical protein